MDEEVLTCYDCGNVIEEGDEHYTNGDGDTICEYCYDENYFTCDRCGEVVSRDYMNCMNNGDYICDNCYDSEGCFTCDRCGEHFYGDGNYCEDDDNYYCDYCYDEVCDEYSDSDDYDDEGYRGIIKSYHNRDIPITFKYTQKDLTNDLLFAKGFEHTADNLLKMGMEIEVINKENKISNNEMAGMIREEFEELELVFEEDGSLGNGFEIITQPMSMSYIREHEDDFKRICEMLVENGFTSHDGNKCGQHIHFSKSYFNDNYDKYVGKLQLFFERYKDEIYRFSRRTSTGWCSWISDNASYNKEYFKSSKILCDYAKRNTGHGVNINLENSNTIEIRVFRGTLKFETLMSNFEFVNSLVHIIREKTTRKINFDKVINYEGNKYVQQYCLEKGIYNSEFMSDETTNIFKVLQSKKDKYELLKEEVKNNIDKALEDLCNLTKEMIANNLEYSQENRSKIYELFNTSTKLQQLITNNMDFLTCGTFDKNDEKVEDNFRHYLSSNSLNCETLINYYKNIRDYIPTNEYTTSVITKMDNIIKNMNEKYIENSVGGDI